MRPSEFVVWGVREDGVAPGRSAGRCSGGGRENETFSSPRRRAEESIWSKGFRGR